MNTTSAVLDESLANLEDSSYIGMPQMRFNSFNNYMKEVSSFEVGQSGAEGGSLEE